MTQVDLESRTFIRAKRFELEPIPDATYLNISTPSIQIPGNSFLFVSITSHLLDCVLNLIEPLAFAYANKQSNPSLFLQMTFKFDSIGSKCAHKVPLVGQWFSLERMHQIEELAFHDYLDPFQLQKSVEIYKRIRNQIVFLYRYLIYTADS